MEKNTSVRSKYIKEAINSAIANNSKNTVARVYLDAAKINFDSGEYNSALNFCKSAIDISSKLKDHDIMAEAYNYFGWIYAKNNHYEDAVEYFLKAIENYEKTGSIEKTGDIFNSIGAAYWHQNNYIKAMEFFERALTTGKDYNNFELQIKAYINIGIIYENLSQYDKALEYQLKALDLAQKTKSPSHRAKIYVNIGNIYFYLKQYEEATNSYLKALDIYEKINNPNGQSICNNNLGECYLKRNKIDKAILYYHKALDFALVKKDTATMSLVMLNIGNAHRLSGRLSKADKTLNKALALTQHNASLGVKSETYLYLGKTALALGKQKEALDNYNKALEIASAINDKQLLLMIYDALAEFYVNRSDYKKAYFYKDKLVVLNDSVNNKKMLENMVKMNAIYQTYQDQATILNLQKENISHSKQLMQEKNKRILFLIVSGSFLIIIIILLILFLYRRRTAIQLREKNEELNNLNATKDKFFSIIAHDLKSPFNSLLGFSEMLSLHAESKNIDQVVEYSNIINNSTKKLFNLVENLLQWSRAQLGTTRYTPEKTDIHLVANNIISLLRLNAEEKDIVISSKIDKDLIGWIDVNLFNTVLRNLLSNAIKFSRVGSMIRVTGIKEGRFIKISVSDSGVGIRRENLEKLFDLGTNISTKGTFNEKGTGLGLILCKEFVEINKGNIWAESIYGNGSTFHFTVPVFDETKNKQS
jgi:signal transduction histidine kinase